MALRAFLSYAREDRERVEGYFDALSHGGYDPWMDCRKILPGQNWEAEIDHALTSANVVLAFLSKSSVSKRGFVQREVNFALDRLKYKLPTDIYLIPLLLEQCDVPTHLASRLQYIDLSVNGAWEQVIASLNLAAEQQQIAAVDGTMFGPFRIVTKTHELHADRDHELRIEYPVFSSTVLRDEAAELSAFFSNRVRRSSAEDPHAAQVTEGETLQDDEHIVPDGYWESFDLTHATQRMISMPVTMSFFFSGAAHPNHEIETFNFVFDRGMHQIHLADLFTDPAAAEQRINRICVEQLSRHLWEITGDDPDQPAIEWIESGCAPNRGNFEHFLLMSDRLSITFSPYQVGPYALGFQSVDISYYELRHFLRPDGPHIYAQSSGDA
ncbi:MAG: TIR domain-containing protein [Luteimonas sp.]